MLFKTNGTALGGESWILANVDGRYEIQRRDETCAESYSDKDALVLVATLAVQGDRDALTALELVNFQEHA